MRAHLYMVLFAAMIPYQASAQGNTEPAAQVSSDVLQSCLLGTGPVTWDQLGLSPDQKERVRRVQEACKEECNVVGAQKPAGSISNADGNTILGEIKGILSADQYRAWVAHCSSVAPAK